MTILKKEKPRIFFDRGTGYWTAEVTDWISVHGRTAKEAWDNLMSWFDTFNEGKA